MSSQDSPNELDNMLREIVESNTHIGLDSDGLPILVALDESMIAQIKQAFMDEGYIKALLPSDPGYEIPTSYMTGQEWLERFERELKDKMFQDKIFPYNKDDKDVLRTFRMCQEAARRASGTKDE